MKRKVLLLALLLAGVIGRAQTPAAITDPKQIVSRGKNDLQTFTVEKLLSTRVMGNAAWSPDGQRIVFVSDISGRENLWTIPATGGWPTQLTVSEQRQTQPAWSPNGRRIAFASDKDGNEQWDVSIVSLADGEVTNLSNTPATAEKAPAWSPDSRFLAWQAKPVSGSSYEIEVFDLLLRRRRALTTNTPKDRSNITPLWSPDGKSIAYTQMRADGKQASVFVVDVATGKSIELTPHTGERRHTASAWSPDGRKLLIASDALSGFENVALLDVASRKIDWLTREQKNAQAGSLSPDGKYASWTTNTDGNQAMVVYQTSTGHTETVAGGAGVDEPGGAFSADGSRLLYSHTGPDSPRDIYVFDLASRQSRPITHSLIAGVRGEDMVQPSLVRYPSRDGKFTISAWLYIPYNQIRNGEVPAVVLAQDGPASQSTDDQLTDGQRTNSFSPSLQLLANQGYFVIVPDYRGSAGYGLDFRDANREDMGGGDVDDLQAAADWLIQTGYVNPKKIVAMGSGYGGYLSLMAVSKSPSTWAAGVALFPFVNWSTKTKYEDPLLRQYDLSILGDAEKNVSLWQERSPIHLADRVNVPLLLLAGGNDPRCPAEEAQQEAEAVKKAGGKVQLKVYENEGHGFSHREDRIDAWRRISDFLKFHVPAPGCGLNACEVP